MPSHPPSRWLMLLGLTAFALNLCWKVLAPFLSVMLWATVLVMVFTPVHRYLQIKIRNRPSLAAFAATLLVLATIILPVVGVATAVTGELQSNLSGLQERITALVQDPKTVRRLPEVLNIFYRYTGMTADDLRQAVQQAGTGFSNWLLQGTMTVVGGALGFVVNLGFVTFTMYYLFRDGALAIETLKQWLPLNSKDSQALIDRAAEIISASVYGVFVIAVVQGMLGGLIFWILGLPSALLWTVVMIILSTIPVLGTFVVWVPAAIVLAATGAPGKALILVLWGVFVIGMSDNLMRPRLVGQKAQMHELLIFFSVLGGLQAFGMLGILMGPVALAIALILLEAFRRVDLAPSLALSETTPVALVPTKPPEEPPTPDQDEHPQPEKPEPEESGTGMRPQPPAPPQ